MPEGSRIDAGRRRAFAAKRAVALTAVGGFVAVLGLARQAHPGAAAAHRPQATPSSGLSSSNQEQGSSLGGGSIMQSPSEASAPSVQTSTS